MIQLANGGVLPVQSLAAGMEFVLQLGGVATVAKVNSPRPWKAQPTIVNRHGFGFKRIIGTFKYTGMVHLMSVTIGDFTHRVTPETSLLVRDAPPGWHPIGSFVVGELLRTHKEMRLIPIQAMTEPKWVNETVYDFEVEDFHTYFVGPGDSAAWAHNGMGGRPAAACRRRRR